METKKLFAEIITPEVLKARRRKRKREIETEGQIEKQRKMRAWRVRERERLFKEKLGCYKPMRSFVTSWII